MVVEGSASLVVRSTTLSAPEITAALGLQPTRFVRKGDRTSARTGANRVYPHTAWILTVDAPNDSHVSELESLARLAALLEDRADALASLRKDAETEIRWFGHSDSSQGGFVIPADVLCRLAELGCDLVGTVYLGEDPEAWEA